MTLADKQMKIIIEESEEISQEDYDKLLNAYLDICLVFAK